MSRYRYATTDKVELEVQTLVTENSFPADIFAIEGEAFRTKSGKILHGSHDCRKIQGKAGVVRVTQMRESVPTDKRCDCFYSHVGGTFGLRLQAAKMIVELEKRAAAVESTTSLLGVQRLQASIDSFDSVHVPTVLEQRFLAASDLASRLLASTDTEACMAQAPVNAVRQCLAEMSLLGRPAMIGYDQRAVYPAVEERSVALLLTESSYSRLDAMAKAWSAFHDAILADQPTDVAVSQGIEAGCEALAEAPKALTQTASVTFDEIAEIQLSVGNVNEALVVAWRKQAKAAIAETVCGWGEVLDQALADALLEEPQLVGISIVQPSHYHKKETVVAVNEKKNVFPRDEAGSLELIVLPPAVVKWLEAIQDTNSSYGSGVGKVFVSEQFPAQHSAAALQVVKGLLENGGISPADAIATAVLAVVPAA